MEHVTRQELRQRLAEIDSKLIELAHKCEAAEKDGEILLALSYAREGEDLALVAYVYAQRLRDLTESAGAYPDVIKAIEDMLND